MFRFIHSSDLHLGKRFGGFTGDLPGRLREARHGVLGRLAVHAREQEASAVMLAGDTFDTETPASDVRRQALTEMGQHPSIRWVLLPGNHDSLQAAELWSRMAAEAPPNVTLAQQAQPLELAPDVFVLPAPCTTRRPGRDTTEWMDAAPTPTGVLRIGLAHGAIQTFTEEGSGEDVIAPDRARRSGLDYLALGDWHGAMQIDDRTFYSGTPEPDRFKHDRPGEALLVSLNGVQALPRITPLTTGAFQWRTLDLQVLSQDDPVEILRNLIPEPNQRRQTLARVLASGHCRLARHAALVAQAEDLSPDFAWFELDMDGLALEHDVDDLDDIERSGALRVAADSLLSDADDTSLSAAERAVAGAALARLYRHAQEKAS
ncbi:metallophosphoesterase family protein [Brevundimonas diminuta]|uniref:DNA repair exonuclease n=3 Tax=Brevundimonas diminuta TaxID=293 RepID=A0A410NV32_BREDI|nr:DNA repair exonuclease [Brevundimonas diminuta]QAT13767.1 DNA repair exonuclease [Brevundimonas diminuta]QQB88869.1 DNA repair exonuclease [Brevundimonas diminuta]GEC02176.1 exonuclease [Brevundimonas diminuta]